MNILLLYLYCTISSITFWSKDGDTQLQKAFEYVNLFAQKDSILAECTNTSKTRKVVVSPQQIAFDINNVMCSFIQKKYKKEGMSCSQINMKEGRLITLTSDSVYREISKIKPIPFNQSVMYNKAREPEIGYAIMFSDVYKNCVMVELRYFCNNQAGNAWGKKAIVFMFEFDAKDNIKAVYQNEKKYR
ncbi:hypothetical protein LV89_02996 [Arcicella aurantiaca]|uniref:Uncharacterized protein n=1 Tax=Arcicella aurantiaca TaxID=591202 RepID=A0A316E6Z2_9BACT|nr:hypothetical protein [Arcicella aurantiaca]PWK24483.1 hypothetical protein LV89_02996 [Arcicella aurantiaca]